MTIQNLGILISIIVILFFINKIYKIKTEKKMTHAVDIPVIGVDTIEAGTSSNPIVQTITLNPTVADNPSQANVFDAYYAGGIGTGRVQIQLYADPSVDARFVSFDDILFKAGAGNNLFLYTTGNVRIGGNQADNGSTLQVPGSISADSSVASLGAQTATGGGVVTPALSIGMSALLGVYFGSGAPTISAGKGSLYLRTDGSGIADRAYINTNGSTTWTALATAG